MPHLPHRNAIVGYYKEVRDQYPDIEFGRFYQVCRSPFVWIKQVISTSRFPLPIIHIKNFGKFRVEAHTVRSMLRTNQKKMVCKWITIEYWDTLKNFLKKYLNQLVAYEQSLKTPKG